MKNLIAEVAPEFTMKRMLDDYFDRFYTRLHRRGRQLRADHFKKATELAAWKVHMLESWPEIELVDIDAFDTDNFSLPMGQAFHARIKLYLNGVDPEQVGLETVFFRRGLEEEELELMFAQPFELRESSEGMATYECQVDPGMAGVYEYGFRLYPKHPLLPHRQDFALVRWL